MTTVEKRPFRNGHFWFVDTTDIAFALCLFRLATGAESEPSLNTLDASTFFALKFWAKSGAGESLICRANVACVEELEELDCWN